MPIRHGLHLVQHGNVAVELVADLHTQLPLPTDALPEPVEVLILLGEDLGVVLVDLLVR